MIQAIAKALLVIFAYPFLPRNLDVNHSSTFRERLDSKKKENFIWLLVWYLIMSLFVYLFVPEVPLVAVTTIAVILMAMMVHPQVIILVFVGMLLRDSTELFLVLAVVFLYSCFFVLLFALSQTKD